MERVLIALLLLAAVTLAVALLRRSRSGPAPARVDAAELGLDGAGVGVVQFSSPRCHSCQRWHAELERAGVAATAVDVSERPELARRYRVRETPLVLAARESDGRVLAAYSGEPEAARVDRLAELTGAAGLLK